MLTYIYQVPLEAYKQFIEYLKSFKIDFTIKRDDSAPHTYGLIQVEAEQEVQDDINIVLDKLIKYYNK